MKKIAHVLALTLIVILLCSCSNNNKPNNYFDFPLKDNGYPDWDNLIINDEVYELDADKGILSNNTDINYEISETTDTIIIVIPKRMPVVKWVAEYDDIFSLTESTLQANLDIDDPVEGESGELQKFVFKYKEKVEKANIKLLLKNVDTTDGILYLISVHVSQ